MEYLNHHPNYPGFSEITEKMENHEYQRRDSLGSVKGGLGNATLAGRVVSYTGSTQNFNNPDQSQATHNTLRYYGFRTVPVTTVYQQPSQFEHLSEQQNQSRQFAFPAGPQVNQQNNQEPPINVNDLPFSICNILHASGKTESSQRPLAIVNPKKNTPITEAASSNQSSIGISVSAVTESITTPQGAGYEVSALRRSPQAAGNMTQIDLKEHEQLDSGNDTAPQMATIENTSRSEFKHDRASRKDVERERRTKINKCMQDMWNLLPEEFKGKIQRKREKLDYLQDVKNYLLHLKSTTPAPATTTNIKTLQN